MKRGKEVRTRMGQQMSAKPTNEIMALMFVMVERAPGAFTLRFVSNDDLLQHLQQQRMLPDFLNDVDRLYSDFRKRMEDTLSAARPN